jgi:hypothetical protein
MSTPQHDHARLARAARALATAGLPALLAATVAQAHEGHGLPGINHWHGSDAGGALALIGVFVVGLWLLGRK